MHRAPQSLWGILSACYRTKFAESQNGRFEKFSFRTIGRVFRQKHVAKRKAKQNENFQGNEPHSFQTQSRGTSNFCSPTRKNVDPFTRSPKGRFNQDQNANFHFEALEVQVGRHVSFCHQPQLEAFEASQEKRLTKKGATKSRPFPISNVKFLFQIRHLTCESWNSRNIHTCNQQVDIVCSFVRDN